MHRKYMKKYSLSRATRDTQIKITKRNHAILSKMSKIQMQSSKFWQACGGRRKFTRYWWECKLVQALWGNTMKISLKRRNRIAT